MGMGCAQRPLCRSSYTRVFVFEQVGGHDRKWRNRLRENPIRIERDAQAQVRLLRIDDRMELALDLAQLIRANVGVEAVPALVVPDVDLRTVRRETAADKTRIIKEAIEVGREHAPNMELGSRLRVLQRPKKRSRRLTQKCLQSSQRPLCHTPRRQTTEDREESPRIATTQPPPLIPGLPRHTSDSSTLDHIATSDPLRRKTPVGDPYPNTLGRHTQPTCRPCDRYKPTTHATTIALKQ
jgi:hypothetical protein